jgi:hypothetical protein
VARAVLHAELRAHVIEVVAAEPRQQPAREPLRAQHRDGRCGRALPFERAAQERVVEARIVRDPRRAARFAEPARETRERALRGRRGREQRVVDARQRDDRGRQRSGTWRPHERLEVRRRPQVLDAHGADLDHGVVRARQTGRLDVHHREARARERQLGHRALLGRSQRGNRELVGQ